MELKEDDKKGRRKKEQEVKGKRFSGGRMILEVRKGR